MHAVVVPHLADAKKVLGGGKASGSMHILVADMLPGQSVHSVQETMEKVNSSFSAGDCGEGKEVPPMYGLEHYNALPQLAVANARSGKFTTEHM